MTAGIERCINKGDIFFIISHVNPKFEVDIFSMIEGEKFAIILIHSDLRYIVPMAIGVSVGTNLPPSVATVVEA